MEVDWSVAQVGPVEELRGPEGSESPRRCKHHFNVGRDTYLNLNVVCCIIIVQQ